MEINRKALYTRAEFMNVGLCSDKKSHMWFHTLWLIIVNMSPAFSFCTNLQNYIGGSALSIGKGKNW